MRLSRQAALAVALTLGLAAVILGYFYLRGQKPPPQEEPQEVQVPVPTEDIPTDTDLMLDMFKPVSFKPDEIPSGAVRDANNLLGHIALHELPEGEPVLQKNIARRSASLALAYGIPKGLRAITVAVDTVAGVANFIEPGDYVDYLAIFNGSRGEHTLCQTVLQNVQVLAVEHQTQRSNGNGNGNGDANEPQRRGSEGDTHITLAVSPHQAQLVALSDTRGEIRLTLRRTGDDEIVPIESSKSWTLIGDFPEEEESGEPSPEQRPDQPPSWADMWGGAPAQAPQAPSTEKEPTKPTEPGARGGIEVIRGSSREYVNPAN